jgi:tetratricopeptide (TPR) repeat protein
MRSTLAAAVLIATSVAALADDAKDCDYWRLAKDKAEEAERLKACDRIISDKRLSRAQRAMAYAERADKASSDERRDDAIADLGQSLALEPDNVDRRRERAYLLHHKGEHDRAIEDFDLVAATSDDDHVIYYRGLSYLAKGDDKRGFDDMAKAIALKPDRPFYYYWRAVQNAKRGNNDVALADVDKAIALKADDEDAYMLRAELYTKTNVPQKAIADLTRASEIKPGYTVPISNRALLYEQSKQFDLALADYDKLLALRPDDAYYRGRKVALLEKLAGAPPVEVREPSPVAPPAAPPKEAESKPVPAPVKEEPSPPAAKTPAPKPPRVAGQGECRRFDPIANLTISVACPE